MEDGMKYYHHCKTIDEQHKTSPAVIVHNNKPKEDDWTKKNALIQEIQDKYKS